MKDRIRQVMESHHMTQQQFAQAIDMAPATLSSIFNGRTKPTLNIVEAIKRRFTNINVDWLLFGSGNMHVIAPAPSSPSSPVSEAAPSSPGAAHGQALALDVFAGEQADATQPSGVAGVPGLGAGGAHSGDSRKFVKNIDKPQRQITEIRVYFDDLTFETFVPSKK